MKYQEHFKFTNSVIIIPVFLVLIIWLVFWFEVRFGFDFTHYGIYPKRLSGLKGLVFSPFIHGSISHLYHNTIPLFVLSASLFYFYKPVAWKVILYGILCSGLLTWVIGRPAFHIGASGLIYVLVSFLFFKGILAKHLRLVALSLLIVFLYGSMIWYVLPIKEGMSWEGHLSGLIVGLVFAFIFKRHIPKPVKYHWENPDYNEEEDEFLKHFDEHGNFIESHTLIDEEDNNQQKINYIFKPDNSND